MLNILDIFFSSQVLHSPTVRKQVQHSLLTPATPPAPPPFVTPQDVVEMTYFTACTRPELKKERGVGTRHSRDHAEVWFDGKWVITERGMRGEFSAPSISESGLQSRLHRGEWDWRLRLRGGYCGRRPPNVLIDSLVPAQTTVGRGVVACCIMRRSLAV